MAELFQIIDSNFWSSLLPIFSESEDYIAKATIQMQINNVKKFPDYPMKAYAPNRNPETGIVFIWKPTEDTCEVSVFSRNDNSLLMEALSHTHLINKNITVVYCNLSSDIHPIVYNMITEQSLEYIIDDTIVAYLPHNVKCKINTEVPTNLQIEVISSDYAKDIDDAWPHRYPGSVEYFKTMLSLGFGLGLFNKVNRELIGWILTTIRGDLHALHIKENFRNKGYAKLLVGIMSKKLIEDGIDVLAYIIEHNKASKLLFEKCGFHFKTNVRWIATGQNISCLHVS